MMGMSPSLKTCSVPSIPNLVFQVIVFHLKTGVNLGLAVGSARSGGQMRRGQEVL